MTKYGIRDCGIMRVIAEKEYAGARCSEVAIFGKLESDKASQTLTSHSLPESLGGN